MQFFTLAPIAMKIGTNRISARRPSLSFPAVVLHLKTAGRNASENAFGEAEPEGKLQRAVASPLRWFHYQSQNGATKALEEGNGEAGVIDEANHRNKLKNRRRSAFVLYKY